ncbi:hypothetical protein BZG01_06590 [Labilibaculum manganireducens]|uniref:Uncharacterized protein n=1 Tax=Labilibaculum manganireducens TaxID=1940525 RepID=A0A2N3IBT1_9BACT|nr:hypothetical protein BZG01_06590 [Labilibaculum manganireducens]
MILSTCATVHLTKQVIENLILQSIPHARQMIRKSILLPYLKSNDLLYLYQLIIIITREIE